MAVKLFSAWLPSVMCDICTEVADTWIFAEEVWAFAHRCLKGSHLKDVFRDFAVDDVCDVAVPEETVRSVVFPEQEHDLFDKDLEAFQVSLSSNQPSGSSFRRLQAASEQPIDLLVPESSRASIFHRSLKSGEAAIEID